MNLIKPGGMNIFICKARPLQGRFLPIPQRQKAKATDVFQLVVAFDDFFSYHQAVAETN